MTTAQASEGQVLALDVVAAIDAVMRHDGADAGARCLVERRASADAYQAAKAHWAARIQAEKEAGQSALVVAYAAAYRGALEKKHRHDAPTARAIERVADPATPSAPPPPVVQREVPTYLAAQPVLVASAPAVAVVEIARAAAPADSLDGTLELQGAIVAAADPLPFVGSESSLIATPEPAVKAAEARARATRSGKLGSTAAIDPARVVSAAALPFAGGTAVAEAASVPELTLNQYASLCAELRVGGRRGPKVLAAYRLPDDAALEHLHRVWARKLDGEPGLRARFDDLSVKYAEWLARR